MSVRENFRLLSRPQSQYKSQDRRCSHYIHDYHDYPLFELEDRKPSVKSPRMKDTVRESPGMIPKSEEVHGHEDDWRSQDSVTSSTVLKGTGV